MLSTSQFVIARPKTSKHLVPEAVSTQTWLCLCRASLEIMHHIISEPWCNYKSIKSQLHFCDALQNAVSSPLEPSAIVFTTKLTLLITCSLRGSWLAWGLSTTLFLCGGWRHWHVISLQRAVGVCRCKWSGFADLWFDACRELKSHLLPIFTINNLLLTGPD